MNSRNIIDEIIDEGLQDNKYNQELRQMARETIFELNNCMINLANVRDSKFLERSGMHQLNKQALF